MQAEKTFEERVRNLPLIEQVFMAAFEAKGSAISVSNPRARIVAAGEIIKRAQQLICVYNMPGFLNNPKTREYLRSRGKRVLSLSQQGAHIEPLSNHEGRESSLLRDRTESFVVSDMNDYLFAYSHHKFLSKKSLVEQEMGAIFEDMTGGQNLFRVFNKVWDQAKPLAS